MHYVPCFVFYFVLSGAMLAAHPRAILYLFIGWAVLRLLRR